MEYEYPDTSDEDVEILGSQDSDTPPSGCESAGAREKRLERNRQRMQIRVSAANRGPGIFTKLVETTTGLTLTHPSGDEKHEEERPEECPPIPRQHKKSRRRKRKRPKPVPVREVAVSRSTKVITQAPTPEEREDDCEFVYQLDFTAMFLYGDVHTHNKLAELTVCHGSFFNYIMQSPDHAQEAKNERRLFEVDMRTSLPDSMFPLKTELKLGILVAELMESLCRELKSAGSRDCRIVTLSDPMLWPQCNGIAFRCGWAEVFCRAGGAAVRLLSRFNGDDPFSHHESPLLGTHDSLTCSRREVIQQHLDLCRGVTGLIFYVLNGSMRQKCGSLPFQAVGTSEHHMTSLHRACRMVSLWLVGCDMLLQYQEDHEPLLGRRRTSYADARMHERECSLMASVFLAVHVLADSIAKSPPELIWSPDLIDLGTFSTVYSLQGGTPWDGGRGDTAAFESAVTFRESSDTPHLYTTDWRYRLQHEWIFWMGKYYQATSDDTKARMCFRAAVLLGRRSDAVPSEYQDMARAETEDHADIVKCMRTIVTEGPVRPTTIVTKGTRVAGDRPDMRTWILRAVQYASD